MAGAKLHDDDSACYPIVLPAGATVRIDWHQEFPTVVVMPTPSSCPDYDALFRIGTMGFITHKDGRIWPPPATVTMVKMLLAFGYAVVLQFDALGDAIACQRHLEAGTAPCQP